MMNLLLAWLLLTSVTVHIRLHDDTGQPVVGERVSLVLYDIRGTTAYTVEAGSCVTNAAGECSIPVPKDAPQDAAGFYRGVLLVGEYGQRSVIWEGETFRVALDVTRLHDGREAEPFPGDDRGVGLQVRPGWQRVLPWVWAGLALLAGGVGWYWWRRA